MKRKPSINGIKINHPANGVSLSRAGKNEVIIARRPPPFGRRGVLCLSAPECVAPFQRTLARVGVGFSKNLRRLASGCLKISPNFSVEAAPVGILRPPRRGRPRICKCASHFLAGNMEVRRAKRGIKPNGTLFILPFGFIANFLPFAEGKTSKFPVKESDNFFALSLLNIFQRWESAVAQKR